MDNKFFERVKALLMNIKFTLFDNDVYLRPALDEMYGEGLNRRVYMQVYYYAKNPKDGKIAIQQGTRHYLEDNMLDDEIIKKAYSAFEKAIEYEVMRAFTYNNVIVFNPEIKVSELLKISHIEVNKIENFDI